MMLSQDRSWNFDGSVENEATLKPLCQQVEQHFQLPAHRLCRYFPLCDDEFFITRYPKVFRGFHLPCRNSVSVLFPKSVRDCFFYPPEDVSFDAPFEDRIAFDDLIYIRPSTCTDNTGFVTTYAHELQHFVQHGTMPCLYAVNQILIKHLKNLEPTWIATDVPSEKEANIVSKRVAEIVCGIEDVRRFTEERIAVMEKAGEQDEDARKERGRWIFFREVPSSTKYDYVADTVRLVEKYKTVLDFGIDVHQPEWWLCS